MALDQVLLDLCCSMAEHSVHHIVPGARVSAAQAIQFTHHVSQQLSMPPKVHRNNSLLAVGISYSGNFSFHYYELAE